MRIRNLLSIAALMLAVLSPCRFAQAKDVAFSYPAEQADAIDLASAAGRAPDAPILEKSGDGMDWGGWNSTDDVLRWNGQFVDAGIYDVQVTYALDDANAGSQVEAVVGDQALFATPPSTGSWGNYRAMSFGNVRIAKAGDVPVIFGATDKPHGYVINLRSVTLFPTRLKSLNDPPKPSTWKALSLLGKRVLWLGDSITQDGKYVTDIEYSLERRFPSQKVDIVSIGLASETTSGLSEKAHPFPRPWVLERLQRALDKVKPNVVVACYGMNDGIYHPQSPERLKAFQKGIGKLIASVRAAGATLILLTPPPFDPLPVKSILPGTAPDFSFMAPYDHYDDVLAEYARWELSLNEPGVTVIDLHTPLSDYLKQRRRTDPGFSYSTDGIHPDAVGHLLMAHVILQALGVAVPSGDLVTQLQTMQTDPIYTLVAQHRQTLSDGWLAYVGYTRGQTVRADSVADAQTRADALQQQIDKLRQPIRLACVGDSITWGVGAKNRDTDSYPAVLGDWLGAGYETDNFGSSGATLLRKSNFSYWDQPQLTQALHTKPNIVIIMLGTNDSKHPTPQIRNAPDNWSRKADFVPDYEDMIAAFKRANPAVKVYVCTPPPAYPGQWGINDTTIREEIAPLVRQVARDTGATVIDVYAALGGKPEMFPDTVHPNNAGARLIAATVYQAVTGKEAPITINF